MASPDERTSAAGELPAYALDARLSGMVELTTQLLDAERCSILLYDEATSELYTRAAVGPPRGTRFPSGQGIAGAVFTSGQAVNIADAQADPRFSPDLDRQTGSRTRNLLCVPIRRFRDGVPEVVGVVEVVNKRAGAFTDADLKLLETLNSQAGSAFVDAVLHGEVEKARTDEGQLLELTAAMSRELQLEPLLLKIIATVTQLLAAERATLFTHDRETDELSVLVGQDERAPEIRFPARDGIAGHVFATGETVNIPDAYADPRFNPAIDGRTGFRTRSVLCGPVVNRKGETIAVIEVLNKTSGAFTALDEKRLQAFTSQASMALDRAQLFEAFLEKERIESGLRLAHDIQMGMLPKEFPASSRFELVAHLTPARSVGGDFYDFLQDGDRLFFVIGDVSGKGVAAALFMAVTKALFRATVQTEPSLSAVLAKVNRELCRDNERAMFVTAFAGWLDAGSGEVVFGNAGHVLPYHVGRDGAVAPVSAAHGLAMGVLPDYEYRTASLRLRPGEALFLCTDGVLEAHDARNEQFGPGRLLERLASTAAVPAAEVVRDVAGAVDEFAKGVRQFDDITLMFVRYGAAGPPGPG
jgi:serine phosphatase RsbU (regulator of sigma subunit)